MSINELRQMASMATSAREALEAAASVAHSQAALLKIQAAEAEVLERDLARRLELAESLSSLSAPGAER